MAQNGHILRPLFEVRPTIKGRGAALAWVAAALVLLGVLVGCDPSGVEEGGPASKQAQPNSTPALIAGAPAATGAAAAPVLSGGTPRPLLATSTPAGSLLPTANPAGPVVTEEYEVREGDTLGAIAARFGTTVEVLMQANDLTSADLISVGQTLQVASAGRAVGVSASSPPTKTPQVSTPARKPGTPTPQPVRTAQAALPIYKGAQVVVNGRTYDAYNQAAMKKGQWYHFTCEFDAAWVVLKTYGFDVPLERQVQIIGQDTSIEPYYKETPDGITIYGGDITTSYSGDYKKNFLARSSGQAVRKLFERYGLKVTAVRDRPGLEAALLRGELVWIKTTADFKLGRVATWVMPDGRTYETVLGNDHALVVMGFNKSGVVVRDPLGPTSTNRQRKYEYDVAWPRFMAAWGQQQYDGLAVVPSGR